MEPSGFEREEERKREENKKIENDTNWRGNFVYYFLCPMSGVYICTRDNRYNSRMRQEGSYTTYTLSHLCTCSQMCMYSYTYPSSHSYTHTQQPLYRLSPLYLWDSALHVEPPCHGKLSSTKTLSVFSSVGNLSNWKLETLILGNLDMHIG